MSGERVVLVGIARKSDSASFESSLEELRSLTETAGGSVVESLSQRLERFQSATLVGEGKVLEIARSARALRARTVIFDENLTPAQQKNLEASIPAKILDRTRLILDIFSQRAHTREGELQVELAQLSYLLPRLTGRWRAYSQQVGGIGTRGPGERQLEYERRHIHRRIQHLKRAIEDIRQERALRRTRRRAVPVPQVAIIGYTNVGKSTLLNALTRDSSVYADDKLFATLDPTARRVRLPEGGWAVFTDTVGFIQKLPTFLVAAFRSTLEEVALADCLVHLMDGTCAHWAAQKRAVETVLDDLEAGHIPRVEAWNKTDLLTPSARLKLREGFPDHPMISAGRKQGLTELLRRVEEVLHQRWILRQIDLAPSEHAAVREIYQCAQVLRRSTSGEKTRLTLRATPENWARLQAKLGTGNLLH